MRGLRQFHASVTLQSGQNVVVSERLGHGNASIITDIYAYSLPGWRERVAPLAFSAILD